MRLNNIHHEKNATGNTQYRLSTAVQLRNHTLIEKMTITDE